MEPKIQDLRKNTPLINFNAWIYFRMRFVYKTKTDWKKVDLCKLNWQVQGIKIKIYEKTLRWSILLSVLSKTIFNLLKDGNFCKA